jgi:hypothetical protein
MDDPAHGDDAGYSGTPLPKKLGIKSGETVTLLGAPDDFDATLGELPDDVRVKRQARGPADRVLLFARSLAELRRRFAAAERVLVERGGLWTKARSCPHPNDGRRRGWSISPRRSRFSGCERNAPGRSSRRDGGEVASDFSHWRAAGLRVKHGGWYT